MSSIVAAIDTHATQYGENCHMEYAWSNETKEKICQLFFQLTRSSDHSNLITKLSECIKDILHSNKTSTKYELGVVLYKILAQTRDIVAGKGEYALAYMQVYVWAEINMNLAKYALSRFVHADEGEHPLGSWKDMKYFANYCHNNSNTQVSQELINYTIQLVNTQLQIDKTSEKPSLLARWIPREKSKQFGWFFKRLALDFYSDWIPNDNNAVSYNKAVMKAKTHYRILVSRLNKKLKTTQIDQCANNWSEINMKCITSQTLQKQKYALQNLTKKGELRQHDSDEKTIDRYICAKNYKTFLEDVKDGKQVMKGKRVGLIDFIKDAINVHHTTPQTIIDTINEQWKNNSSQTGALKNFIAMIDTSGSMMCDGSNPLHAALGLGVRIAEKSTFGRRVMTFSASPEWVNLEDCDTLTSMVKKIKDCKWGMNTNFYAAMKLILDAIVANRLPESDVKDMVLAVFSDMQIDQAGNSHTMMKNITDMYAEAGNRICGKPYTPPHILFWNLRSTTGFPTSSTQNNATMCSGFSPALLNVFCEKGLEGVLGCTPWTMLEKSLDNPRYKIFEEKFRSIVE